jgi:ABC-type branched-subunit amino acid transport system substrate-binding protein
MNKKKVVFQSIEGERLDIGAPSGFLRAIIKYAKNDSELLAVLKEVKPDIVFIATHPDTHLKMVRKAVMQGIKLLFAKNLLQTNLAKQKKLHDTIKKDLQK